MASLTQTAFYARKIIKYGGLGIILLFTFKLFLNTTVSVWKKLHPPPPPPPTVSFGKIPKIQFPLKKQPKDLRFKLETPTGQLPELSDRANVYFIPYKRANLLALERAKEEASRMGFVKEPTPLTDRLFQWIKNEEITTVLKMDIISGAFTFSYNWQRDPTILLKKQLPGEQQAKLEAQSFLKTAGLLSEDILTGKSKISYLKTIQNKFILAVSLSEADFVKVDFFRKDVDNQSVLTADSEQGIISFILSGSSNARKKIIKVEYNYFPVNYTSSASYPIKPVDSYWQQLQQNEAFVASWKGTENQITIRRVYLAYFDSYEVQSFFQPIIVFEGDNSFIAYLPAISSEWFQ